MYSPTKTRPAKPIPASKTINIPEATWISISLLLALDLGSGQLGLLHHLKGDKIFLLTPHKL